MEIPEHCVASVLEIRRFLTQVLTEKGDTDELAEHLRAACGKFLIGRAQSASYEYVFPLSEGFDEAGTSDWALNQALNELK